LADSILPLPVISDFDFPQEIQNHKEITEMKKRYFIRKTDSTEKERPEWIELNGAEFYAFTADPANKDKRFVILGGEGCEEAETLYLEADEKEYSKWKTDENHRQYLRRTAGDVDLISLNAPAGDETLEDLIPDEPTDFTELLSRQRENQLLAEALSKLTAAEKDLIDLLFLKNKNGKSEREIARELGIARMTLSNRKLVILKKIKKYLVQNGI
jgi:RNA polymerase sigma factor (sigma-70 family)